MIHLLEEERKEKKKKKRKKRSAGERDVAGCSWPALEKPQCPTSVVSKGTLPCKPLWPDTSSPDPGAETCVSASDTCPGKACGPWQHRKQEREWGRRTKGREGRGREEMEEKNKNKNKNHTSRKNIERKMQRTIK